MGRGASERRREIPISNRNHRGDVPLVRTRVATPLLHTIARDTLYVARRCAALKGECERTCTRS
eukprot:4896777-Pleurochrysis_carterae.AAC.1